MLKNASNLLIFGFLGDELPDQRKIDFLNLTWSVYRIYFIDYFDINYKFMSDDKILMFTDDFF